jgi:hypothetical protein
MVSPLTLQNYPQLDWTDYPVKQPRAHLIISILRHIGCFVQNSVLPKLSVISLPLPESYCWRSQKPRYSKGPRCPGPSQRPRCSMGPQHYSPIVGRRRSSWRHVGWSWACFSACWRVASATCSVTLFGPSASAAPYGRPVGRTKLHHATLGRTWWSQKISSFIIQVCKMISPISYACFGTGSILTSETTIISLQHTRDRKFKLKF